MTTEFEEKVATKVVTISPAILTQLSSVAVCAGDDSARPLLTNIHMYSKDGHLVADATDSHVLGRIVVEVPGIGDFDTLVPAKWLVSAVKSLKIPKHRQTASILMIEVTGDTLTLRGPDGSSSVSIMDGTFPSVDQVIPAAGNYVSEPGSFNASFLSKMSKMLPEKVAVWECVSMSPTRPSVWTRDHSGASALFLIMPSRNYKD